VSPACVHGGGPRTQLELCAASTTQYPSGEMESNSLTHAGWPFHQGVNEHWNIVVPNVELHSALASAKATVVVGERVGSQLGDCEGELVHASAES
jgi:hypothetical protein